MWCGLDSGCTAVETLSPQTFHAQALALVCLGLLQRCALVLVQNHTATPCKATASWHKTRTRARRIDARAQLLVYLRGICMANYPLLRPQS